MRILLTKSYNTVLIIIIVPLTLLSVCLLLLVHLGDYTANLCSSHFQDHRETDRFLEASGVHLVQAHFHYRHTSFSTVHRTLYRKWDDRLLCNPCLELINPCRGIHVQSKGESHQVHVSVFPHPHPTCLYYCDEGENLYSYNYSVSLILLDVICFPPVVSSHLKVLTPTSGTHQLDFRCPT